MEDTEEEKRPPPSDICSQINLISSIQYQQNELSKLAKLLQSERDREKYIKVIEMSKIIQSKLDYLQDEKKKANITLCTNKNRNSFGHLDKKNSMWSLSNYYYTNSCRSSTATSSTTSGYSSGSENTLSTHSSSIYCISSGLEEEEEFSPVEQQQQQQSRYHTYNGHSYRVIDRATSLQFQHMQDSIYNSRRPSADIILVDLCLKKEQEKVYVKSNSLQHRKSRNKKRRSFKATTTASTSRASMEISDEEEEVLKAIHVAVRRDASLFKIVKDKPIQDNIALTTTNKNYHSAVVTTTAAAAAITTPKNAIIPVVHPLPPLPHHLFEQNVVIEKKRVSFSDEQNNKKKTSPPTNGLFTPPDSPASQNRFDREISAESCLDLNALPHIIHVQKKTHQSLKGLLKRTYQLNQYTVTRTNSITLPFSTGILYKTCNSINGKQKLLLKLVIISLDVSSSEKQRRFGFTFWWQNHSVLIHSNSEDNRQQDDAKFALAPDSLVKEALVTWIESQNEGGVTLLPSLSQSDEILRDGRKLHIVYDTNLFI